ncbi:parathyroid hormone/parathyroid hormone-related peptide receptor-like isoform X1 [Zophobas morio]|uniref:parathyroid hormone/parathyroid hormone-related peptide receptor-like isoform X1 n=1 Tax=Zophobas morio TaxID=2755281 RepID=UPI003082C7B8
MIDPSELDDILERANFSCGSSGSKLSNGKFCQLVFDGIMCWRETPAGVLAKQSCSNEFIKSIKKGLATKQCDENGDWLTINSSPWTNYSQCGGFYIEKIIGNETSTNHTIYDTWIPIIEYVTQVGYVLSTVSLLIALFIFIRIKRLHCARNKLHMHFFGSFVMRAFMSLIKIGLFVKGTALPHETIYVDGEPVFNKTNYSWVCKAIVSLWHYFIISNYTFLLMEGAYLHNLLFLKLLSENGVAIYYCVGWGFPLFFILPWIILKALNENKYCWTTQSSKYIALLIDVPIGLTVLINFILFVLIIRILFVKLTSMYMQRWTQYQKLVRAILILVPLFGIPYAVSFVLSFYVTQNRTFEILWIFFDQSFTAFQGLFASLVYCLMNSDVQVEVVRKYRLFKDRNNREFKRRSRTISHTTQIALAEELQELPQGFGDEVINKTSDYF